ncbi:MAG: aspartate-semialdehyde dehydrogenase [Bacteroidia bacterium]
MKIAIIGATGLVGRKMMQVLDESGLPVDELYLAASERSKGSKITFQGRELILETIGEVLNRKPDAALFSAGGDISMEWAEKFADAGVKVIDNSSAWRMHPEIKLIVPEINGFDLTPEDKIIANPNCSTIQLVMVLNPLHERYGIKRVLVSTYQSVSGSGNKGIGQMMDERTGTEGKKAYPHTIDQNCLPHCDAFTENGYTREEMKLMNESRKILKLPALKLSATAVRVPVQGGHSESVNIEFENKPDVDEIREILSQSAGVIVQDDPGKNLYPMPLLAKDQNEVFVGRIRADLSNENAINLWIVADNIRKGAATNAVQILGLLMHCGFLEKDQVSQ